MLFLLNERGVPSVARWIRLGADATTEALPGATGLPPEPPRSATPRAGRRAVLRASRAGGLRVPVRCSSACSVRVTLRLDRRNARNLGLRGVVGRGSTRLRRAGTTRVLIKLTGPAGRRLRRVGTVSGTVRIDVRYRGKSLRRVSRRVRLRR